MNYEAFLAAAFERREPPHAPQIYGCLGCNMQCRCCARAVRSIMSEALMSCAPATDANLPQRNNRE
jgi:bacterioferritin-associated ferredoxin